MWFSRRRSKLAIAGLSAYVALLVAVMGFVVWDRLSRAEMEAYRKAVAAASDPRNYTGTIIIPDPATGRCRSFEFDNNTGALREGAAGPCRDDTAVNATEGRLSAIRNAFVKR